MFRLLLWCKKKEEKKTLSPQHQLFIKLTAVSPVRTVERWWGLDLLTSGLPPARQTDIISLFISRHGSKWSSCQAEKWHFGALPSQPGIEKFVKWVTEWVPVVRGADRGKEPWIRETLSRQWSQQDGKVYRPHFARPGCWTRPRELCLECQPNLGSVSFVSVSALILLFTNCSAASTR